MSFYQNMSLIIQRPNPIAARRAEANLKVVVLDVDVAQVFSTAEAVNHALRSLISAMPS